MILSGMPLPMTRSGENYFDMKRKCACSSENLILYGDGDEVIITAQDRPVRFSPGVGTTNRRACRMVWPHRYEHPRGIANCLEGI